MRADETRRATLAGDPIESVQQGDGVAPVTINNVTSPDGGSIDGTSFTIGLFDEDAALCPNPGWRVYLCGNMACISPCGVSMDINPAHPSQPPFPDFDDVTTVDVTVNVGSSGTMHWDWEYKAYYGTPIGEFWVDVVDQAGQTVRVLEKVNAPADWGFSPLGPRAKPAFMAASSVDLDLSPWRDQRIVVRFSLHSSYDPNYFAIGQHPPVRGAWDAGASKVYITDLRVDTCRVDALELQPIDSEIDVNPIAPFGKRIFPDKQSLNDASDRSLVCVVARTSAPGCRVTFRVLDVDDPASHPLIDPSDAGDDNDPRGVSGLTSAPACPEALTSGADGVARTAFRASKFPGDNFVIVAGANADDVAAVKSQGQDVVNADGTPLPASATVQKTPLLTVWRRLHLQRDSMGMVTGNHAAGTIRTVTPAQNTPDLVQLRVDTALDLRRFEGGRLVIDDRSFVVNLNSVNSIYVIGQVADFRQFRSRPFRVYDDDDYNLNDRPNFVGDVGEDVRMPSTFLVRDSDSQEANVFAAAYVRPVYDLSSTDSAPFALNITDYDDVTIRDLFSLDAAVAANDGDFWALALMAAYQGTVTSSRDPNDDSAVLGVVDFVGGSTAVVFLETIADVRENAVRNESTTVAHELGHLFCLHHGEGGIMGTNAGGAIADIVFSPLSIARIRRAIRWHGPCEAEPNAN
jgi:hypothetical protein